MAIPSKTIKMTSPSLRMRIISSLSAKILLGCCIILIMIMSTHLCTNANARPSSVLSHQAKSRSQKLKSSLSPYRIIIDGGSTGSRLHIFEFIHDMNSNITSCIRRGSTKAEIPLSDFGRASTTSPTASSSSSSPLEPDRVAEHLMPLFRYAAEMIPPQYHPTTSVQYQATAGMRLLDEEEQEAVYDALYLGLVRDTDFVFADLERGDITTLGGEEEGFFGAVAANYLKGLIDVRLHMIGTESGDELGRFEESKEGVNHGPLGALDMGGASMQVVFSLLSSMKPVVDAVDNDDVNNVNPQVDDTKISQQPLDSSNHRLHIENFFSTSYLSYGVDQFRERLWDTWIEEHNGRDQVTSSKSSIYNPCSFKGYTMEWKGHVFEGTGNAQECMRQVNRLIPDQIEVAQVGNNKGVTPPTQTRTIGGVEHPPVRGKFLAMSLFFFTLDCLRELSDHEDLKFSWPTPSIGELVDALDGLCSRSWHGDLESIKDDAHSFTRAQVLPHRCFESVYLVTLLRDGFGFHPSSRDITFTFLVDGSEVEWSMGMALAKFADEGNPVVSIQSNDTTSDSPMDDADSSSVTNNTILRESEATTSSPSSLPLTFLSEVAPSHWMIDHIS